MKNCFFALSVLCLIIGSCAIKSKPNKVLVSPALMTDPDTLLVIADVDTLNPLLDTVFSKVEIDSSVGDKNIFVLDSISQIQFLSGINKEADFAPALHHDLRRPQYVMIHHTSQNSLAQTIRTFQLPHTKVSSHYVIGRDGQMVQMLNDYLRAWHAGVGKWAGITDMNSISIGIELDNNGREPFPESQINTLLSLLDTLKIKHRIPTANFIGHADYAPARKDDPSSFFPWKTLADKGFGIWFDVGLLETPPSTFNPIDGLRIIGYDTTNLRSTLRAFRKKYALSDTDTQPTEQDIKIIYNLYRKYY